MSKILLFCCNIGFVAIYVLLWQICFVAIYALLCGEKIIQKLHMWRKNDKYQVCPHISIYPFPHPHVWEASTHLRVPSLLDSREN